MSATNVPEVACHSALGVLAEAQKVISDRCHPLLLFDKSARNMHDAFVKALVSSIAQPDYGLWMDGKNIRRPTELYNCIRRTAPYNRQMGSNLNAVEEILRDDAVSRDRISRTYWIYTDCDGLYEADLPFLAEFIQMMLSAARQLGEGYFTLPGGFVPATRPVSVVLTGSWEALGAEATSDWSFLYRFPDSYERAYPDLFTGLRAVHIKGRV